MSLASLASVYNPKSPAYLMVGSDHQLLIEEGISFLKMQWCLTKQPACACVACRQIGRRQHQALTWISPESGDYTVQELELVFSKTCFALQKNKQHFFVFEHSDRFNQATANRLLKLLEEPPVGYIFIMMTTNLDRVLATIRSRSIILSVAFTNVVADLHPLCALINPLNHQSTDPGIFDKVLQEHKPSPRESVELVEDFVQYMQEAYRISVDERQRIQLSEAITRVLSMLKSPPQAGGSIMFWRQLFMVLSVSRHVALV